MKKLVFVGCGGIADYHVGNMLGYKNFLEENDIRFAGFCDLIPERAQKMVEWTGSGKAYTDFRKMYDEVQPDMAFICVPPYCHGEIDLETFSRGIPAYVEKPLSLDLDFAEEVLGIIRKNRVITAIGFQCRYGNITDLTKKFCDEHQIVFCDMVRMGGIPEVFWWRKKELSGGQIVEQTIHNFDLVRYALGADPVEVCTFGARGFVKGIPDYDTEDLSTTIVRFANGTLGTFSTGDYAEGPGCYESKTTFSAKDARLDHHLLNKIVIFDSAKQEENASVVKGDGFMRGTGDGVTIDCEGDTGPIAEQTFFKAVLTGDDSRIRSPYSDGIKSLAFTIACNQSMAKGKVVKVRNF
ncbi:MAG: Gfo/Idh/MocA family protein [Christensenellales bacterium]|jgi:myo-inositol 2-dehydrogenase/D-chiro-inositol 1-dehydrogenase